MISAPPVVSPPPQYERRYQNINDTAAWLGCGAQWVSMMILEGRLEAINIAPYPDDTRALMRIPVDAVIAPVNAWRAAVNSCEATTAASLNGVPCLTPKAIADRLSCSLQNISNLIEAGKLCAVNLATRRLKGRACYRIPALGYLRFLASCRVE